MSEPQLPRFVSRFRTGFRGRIYLHGKQVTTKVYPDPWQAKIAVERLRAALGRDDGGEAAPATLGLIIDEVQARLDKHRSRGTQSWFRCHSKRLLEAWPKDTMIHRVDREQVQAFVDRRTVATSPATVAHDIRALSLVFNHAQKRGYWSINPLKQIDRPTVKAKPRDWFTPEEVSTLVHRILRTPHKHARRDADLVLILFWTGLRRSELARLQVSDVHIAREIIEIDGKCGHRTVMMHPELVPVLLRVMGLRKEGPLVTGSAGVISHRTGYWRDELGEPRLHAHALRHSFAFLLVDQMALDINKVAALMGHESIETTRKYFHVKTSALRDALKRYKLPPPVTR